MALTVEELDQANQQPLVSIAVSVRELMGDVKLISQSIQILALNAEPRSDTNVLSRYRRALKAIADGHEIRSMSGAIVVARNALLESEG